MSKYVSVTTTNSIEGTVIENHFGVITSHIVFGTHLFSDLAATFTDFFGGQSGTYQKKLERLYEVAMNQLKDQASQIGANAIIGFKIDFDEISGKGKSMFMVSAIGTAVNIKGMDSKTEIKDVKTRNIVSSHDVEVRLMQKRILALLESRKFPSQDEWDFLLDNPSDVFNEYLISLYERAESVITLEEEETLKKNVHTYFGGTESDSAIKSIYNKIRSNEKLINLLAANNLFSPTEVLSLFKDGYLNSAIACLSLNKGTYNKDSDIPLMEQIVKYIDEIPDTGEQKVIQGGLISKEKEKFICPEGHQNDSDELFCKKCGKNIRGLTSLQTDIIDEFKNRISAIKELLG